MHYLNETNILIFLVQVFIILLFARGLGELFRKWGQPALTAELLVGVLLGPTILGRFLPSVHVALFPATVVQQTMLETVAWVGVLFLLLTAGFEIDFSIAWRQRGNALTIAISDIIVPMVVSFAFWIFMPDHYLVDPSQRLVFALFMATVMTISAMPVSARALHDINLLKADIGFLIMSALAVNDIIGWVLFTIVLGLFSSTSMDLTLIAVIFSGTVGFAALALWLGPRISTRTIDALRKVKLPEPGTSLTFACLLGLLFGAFTQKLGIHALFGFFIAGVVVGEAKNLSEQTRGIITEMVHAIFVPLFFVNIGLKIDFFASFDPLLVLLMCVIGTTGRYLGAWFGVSMTKVPRMNRDLISIAHTSGGMMEIVVAVLALETNLITSQVFVAIVFSAVFSSLIMGPWMRKSMSKRASVRVADFLSSGSLIPSLKSFEREGVIKELADRVAAQAGLSSVVISDAALSRETEFGTGTGHGVAIPHVRLPSVKKPVVAMGRSLHGIDWNSPDGEPVHSIFFILSPEGVNDVHIQLLSEVARAMRQAENRERVEEAEGLADLWRELEDIFSKNRAGQGKDEKEKGNS